MAQTEGFCCLSRLCIYMTNSCPTVGGFEDPGPSETGVPDVIDRTDMILSADIASVDALDSGRASSRFRPQYDQRVQSLRIRWMLAVVMSDRTLAGSATVTHLSIPSYAWTTTDHYPVTTR